MSNDKNKNVEWVIEMMKNKIPVVIALIVTFNPEIEIFNLVLNAINEQVATTVIIDNNSTNIKMIEEIIHEFGNKISLVKNKENYGLGKALNLGIEQIGNFKADWVLILDQDSIPTTNYVALLFRALENYHKEIDSVCVIRSEYRCKQINNNALPKLSLKEIKTSIMSGTIVKFSLFNYIVFREEFFLDFIDSDFYYRVVKFGGTILMVQDCLLTHKIGRQLILFGRRLSYEEPLRVYYMIRNSTCLFLEGRFSLRLLYAGYSPIFLTLSIDGLRTAVRALIHGIIDAFFMRLKKVKKSYFL